MPSTDAEKQAFKEKLKSLHFGVVPGAYRDLNSTSMIDKEGLDIFPNKEEVMDMRSDFNKDWPDLD